MDDRAPQTQQKTPISLTVAAVTRVHELIGKEPGAVALWAGLKTKGCSGLSYDVRFITQAEIDKFQALPRFERPEVITQDGVTVYVDSKAMINLFGTTMDWVDDGITARFDFVNPNEKGRCGCGESFHV